LTEKEVDREDFKCAEDPDIIIISSSDSDGAGNSSNKVPIFGVINITF
jgi:hypothetical protein